MLPRSAAYTVLTKEGKAFFFQNKQIQTKPHRKAWLISDEICTNFSRVSTSPVTSTLSVQSRKKINMYFLIIKMVIIHY